MSNDESIAFILDESDVKIDSEELEEFQRVTAQEFREHLTEVGPEGMPMILDDETVTEEDITPPVPEMPEEAEVSPEDAAAPTPVSNAATATHFVQFQPVNDKTYRPGGAVRNYYVCKDCLERLRNEPRFHILQSFQINNRAQRRKKGSKLQKCQNPRCRG